MTLEKQIAEDYGMVLKEAQSMGCNKINALYNIPLDNMKAIVNALEEVQQYRAMEKRLDAIYGDCPGLLETVVKHLERHDGIGTDKPAFKARLLTDDNVDKWDSYKEIGTVEECRAAVEKQKPKKPIDRCMYKECPACGSVEIQNCGYCTECGQKLDWSDEE